MEIKSMKSESTGKRYARKNYNVNATRRREGAKERLEKQLHNGYYINASGHRIEVDGHTKNRIIKEIATLSLKIKGKPAVAA